MTRVSTSAQDHPELRRGADRHVATLRREAERRLGARRSVGRPAARLRQRHGASADASTEAEKPTRRTAGNGGALATIVPDRDRRHATRRCVL